MDYLEELRDLDKVYKTGEIKKICSSSSRTVARWIDEGRLRGFRIPYGSRDRRVLHKDLVEFMEENNIPFTQLKIMQGFQYCVNKARAEGILKNLQELEPCRECDGYKLSCENHPDYGSNYVQIALSSAS